MPANCFYTTENLEKHTEIFLSEEEEYHAKKVMRAREGDEVIVLNGNGSKAHGIINRVKPELAISIQETHFTPFKETYSIAQALTIASKLELITEKLTELDASNLYFFPAKNSEKNQLNPHQKNRLGKIIIQAIKQSGRLYLPKLHFFDSIEDIPKSHSFLFGQWEQEKNSLPQAYNNPCFLNGPEKGLTKEEKSYLRDRLNAKTICLCRNTLRTETAAIAAGCFLTLCKTI